MNKKKIKILCTIVAFLLCFPLHFLYDKFPCFLTSVIAPINESIWEHMKILFSSILFTGVMQKIITIIKHDNTNNICISNYTAAITSIPIFLILYLPLYYTIGENLLITIIIMLLTIIIAEIISYIIMNNDDLKLENITIIFAIITYIIFAILTYHPLNNDLFIEPVLNCLLT